MSLTEHLHRPHPLKALDNVQAHSKLGLCPNRVLADGHRERFEAAERVQISRNELMGELVVFSSRNRTEIRSDESTSHKM